VVRALEPRKYSSNYQKKISSVDDDECLERKGCRPERLQLIAMAKRKQPPSGMVTGSNKRTKPVHTKSSRSKKQKRAVDVNSLPWQKVDVPEMFDDAEGFYGLEVIDGVDIVRDGETVQFVSYTLSFSHLFCDFC
jgi:hypothetical protein